MKKIFLISVCLFLISVPKFSSSQNDLSEKDKYIMPPVQLQTELYLIVRELRDSAAKLRSIALDLNPIGQLSDHWYISLAEMKIGEIASILTYESEFLAILDLIKNEHVDDYCNHRINWLIIAKQLIEKMIDGIRLTYAAITNNAALHLIDKAKETAHSSLVLLDKSIETLKSINETKK